MRLDVYFKQSNFSIAVDRLQDIERKINDDFSLILNKDFMASKDKYTKDLYHTMNVSVTAGRAKIGSLNLTASKNKEDPLLNALKEANEYDG